MMETRKRKLDDSPEIIEIQDDDEIIELSEDKDESKNDESKAKRSKPSCKYGSECFRSNPAHFEAFSHPEKHEISKPTTSSKIDGEKLSSEIKPPLNTHIYLTKLHDIRNAEKLNSTFSLSLSDILLMDKSDFLESAQFNYMHDLQWLIKQYPIENRQKPLTLIHDHRCDDLKHFIKLYDNVKLVKAKLPDAYGTHHTKMMFLLYKTGIRIVIHTANLIEEDWMQKTQGIWISDLFPKLSEDECKSALQPNYRDLFDSKTNFKKYLIVYLDYYKEPKLNYWIDQLKFHDMRNANVFLIGSVPGRLPSNKQIFGHLRLRKMLSGYFNKISEDEKPKKDRLIAQFSSIGSLGSTENNWLCKEFYASLSTTLKDGPSNITSKPICIYPTCENVRTSFEGFPAGQSLPYFKQVADKQPYLNDFFYKWKSDLYGRTRASPHIKSYARLSNDFTKLYWFLLTSANLSKAAWGTFEKNESQLFIRSYEMGVLFLPKVLDENSEKDYFDLDKKEFLMPYDLPPVKYNATDKPWIVDDKSSYD